MVQAVGDVENQCGRAVAAGDPPEPVRLPLEAVPGRGLAAVPPHAPVSHLKSRHDRKDGNAHNKPSQMAAEDLQRAAHGRRRGWGGAVHKSIHERGHVAAPAVGDGERADRVVKRARLPISGAGGSSRFREVPFLRLNTWRPRKAYQAASRSRRTATGQTRSGRAGRGAARNRAPARPRGPRTSRAQLQLAGRGPSCAFCLMCCRRLCLFCLEPWRAAAPRRRGRTAAGRAWEAQASWPSIARDDVQCVPCRKREMRPRLRMRCARGEPAWRVHQC